MDEPPSAHRAYPYTAFLALERPQGRAARFPRRHLLDAGRLSVRIPRSAFWSSEVIARAGADLEVFCVVASDTHFNFVIAGSIGARWGVADVVLRVQLAADFVDGFFDGAVLEGREVRASRGGRGDFERVIFHLIVNVLNDPDGRGHQVNIAVAVLLAGGSLRDAWLRRQRKRAGRSDLRPRIFGLGL